MRHRKIALTTRFDAADTLYFAIRISARTEKSEIKNGIQREYRFDAERKWRFDFAWPDKKVAVEVDGGRWKPGGGRHASDADMEKTNRATELGWRVFRFSASQVVNDPVGVAEKIDEILRV